VLAWLLGSLQWSVSLFRLSFPQWLKSLIKPLVCLHNFSVNNWCDFSLSRPQRLVISFIAFIHIVCCLNIPTAYIKLDLFSFWWCFKTNVILDWNRDYFQCNCNLLHCDFVIEHVRSNRNRLCLWCNRPMYVCQLPYRRPSSYANCARELFKPSKDSASLLVCTRKKSFGWGLRILYFGSIAKFIGWFLVLREV